MRSGSPAACYSPCWPVLASASRSRTGFDTVERPSYEGCSVLRCLVKVSRLPGPRSDANGRAGSPLAGRQKTGSHMAGRPRTGSRVAAADRVTHGRPAEGRVAHGRPLWVRVTGGRRGQGHTWPAAQGQGHPWPPWTGSPPAGRRAVGQPHRRPVPGSPPSRHTSTTTPRCHLRPPGCTDHLQGPTGPHPPNFRDPRQAVLWGGGRR